MNLAMGLSEGDQDLVFESGRLFQIPRLSEEQQIMLEAAEASDKDLEEISPVTKLGILQQPSTKAKLDYGKAKS